MRIVDSHIHLRGPADGSEILKTMDKNQVERVIIISPSERVSFQQTRANLVLTQKVCQVDPKRIGALAWLEPTIPGIKGLAQEALENMGFAGIKMAPDHWYPYEERLEPFWEKMHDLKASILFHTGILYAKDDSSRFCRPVYLEKLMHYPDIRFAMAHISWPWCDECLAVMGRMQSFARKAEVDWQSYIDITPGTPDYIRKQAISNAIDFCGLERLMFGTDSTLPGDLSSQRKHIERDLKLFEELGLTEAQQARIMSGTADELFPVG